MALAGEYAGTRAGQIELAYGARRDKTHARMFQVRDGQLAQVTEYFDPTVLQDAFGKQLQSRFNVR